MSASGAASPVNAHSPGTPSAGQSASPGTNVAKQLSSPGSVTTVEPAPPGSGSGGHPDRGSQQLAAVTSTTSGVTTSVEHAPVSSGVTSASSVAFAAPSTNACGYAEQASATDGNGGAGRALRGRASSATRVQLEPSQGTTRRTMSPHNPRSGAVSPVSPSTSERTAAKNYHCTLVLTSCGFLAVLSSLVMYRSSFHQRVESHLPLCNTENCRAHASLLTKRLNWTLDPCEDFHAFVCSAARSSSRRDTLNGVMDELRLSWFQGLRDIIFGGTLHIPVGMKALAMHRRCLEKYPSDKPAVSLFLYFIREQGLDWPRPTRKFEPPLQFALKLAHSWQSPFWMSVSVLGAPDQSSSAARLRFQIRLSMLVPGLLYHHRLARRAYLKYWELFLHHLYPDSNTRPDINKTHVEGIRVMEEQILETLNSLVISGSPKPAVFSFGNISAYVPNATAFEWLRSFEQSIPLRRQLSYEDEIFVSDVRLLRTVSELIQKYDVGQLNMHLTWLLVQYCAPVADYAILVDHYGSRQKAAAHLPVFCGRQTEASYKILLAALDFVFRFDARDIKTINDGFDDVVLTAVEKVNVCNWIDGESKARLIEKILTVKKSLWPPEAVVNADLLEKLYGAFTENSTNFAAMWIETRKSASDLMLTGEYEEVMRLPWNSLPGYIFYDYVSNTVEMATATIAAPLYYRNGAKAMLYGGLLFLMTSHLVRAFDREGVRWAPNGSEVGSILSNATLFQYHDRDRCFDGAVEHSLFPEVPAFEIAYTAMKHSHVRDNSMPLPLRNDLSEDKVFFMTLCYISCSISGDQHYRNFDCNKVARNSKAFAEAFHCPIGSKMNPQKKCQFFV
ncbi:endothelin-converting enzyme 1-like isoform X2 [Dermacentor albipictus]|uniref:endothelin-converting enzyme 1-like isoform X2 n=1 Tax=Dermacentor albipictus TaxID=60249 RepID=UPI0038FCDCA6